MSGHRSVTFRVGHAIKSTKTRDIFNSHNTTQHKQLITYNNTQGSIIEQE